jgi:hypothetical protein
MQPAPTVPGANPGVDLVFTSTSNNTNHPPGAAPKADLVGLANHPAGLDSAAAIQPMASSGSNSVPVSEPLASRHTHAGSSTLSAHVLHGSDTGAVPILATIALSDRPGASSSGQVSSLRQQHGPGESSSELVPS